MQWLSFIRRVTLHYVGQVNARSDGIASVGVYSITAPTKRRIYYQTTGKSYHNKMSFEECIFQPINKKGFSSSMEYYDNKNVVTSIAPSHGASSSRKGEAMESNGTNNNNNDIDCREQQHSDRDYEEAVKALNSLQSNAESLRSSLHQQKRVNSLKDTEKYLIRSGLNVKDLEALSVIHVAGTKGKGSTCALTESILRHYGVKTGFYSSPHLVSLTERIRLNGQPISKELFTHYFWKVYNPMKAQEEYDNDMPAYFKFLTIMCLHVYLAEKVEAVILEVGIGGELDCTNIVPNTKTVAISSLGLEHTQLLGNTLGEIAWQKAGIIKPQSMVYTSVTQPECLEVLKQRAQEKNATLHIVPEFETYFADNDRYQHARDALNNVVLLNGSLAIQLAYDWLRQNRNGFGKQFEINKPLLTEQVVMALMNCNWPGRCQVVKFFNFNMHLDGAHTVESMQVCGDWFAKVTRASKLPRILIFNTTGDRDSRKLLTILRNFSHFDLICFGPNISSTSSTQNHDNQSILYTQVEQLKRAQMHAKNWAELCQESGESNRAMTFPSIVSCFQHIRKVYGTQELDLLVTGSLHLIGATILSLNELGKDLSEAHS